MDVPEWPEVFRGSTAIRSGLVTPGALRSRKYERLHPDVYRRRTAEPPSFHERSRGAALLVGDRGVLSGYSAAELLGARCAPVGAPAEVTVTGRVRARPGLLVHRDALAASEVAEVGGVRVTSGMRTAYDLARRLDLPDAVVAVDRLANVCRFDPDILINFLVRYQGARGSVGVPLVLAHADYRSGSPPESLLRLRLRQAGLPRPEVQWVVQDPASRTAVWLDLAYPEKRIGIEYEGAHHTEPDAVLRDAGRYTRLVDKGWRIYRYTKLDIRDEPDRIVAEIRRALADDRHTTAVPTRWIAEYAERTRRRTAPHGRHGTPGRR